MIKLFRKIRQNLLSENKFSKYLIYAIGEIILVVLGILIALTLNNNNERKKSEAKTLVVFEELLGELASDIKSIKNAGLFYEEKDSLTFLVLNTSLNREEYQNNLGQYNALTTQTTIIDLSNNAYNKLVLMSDAIPVEYRQIMRELYRLNQKKEYVDLLNNRMIRHVNDIIKHKLYNYTWAVNFNQQEFIDYLYNDSRYKSDVKLLSNNGVNEHFQHAFYYLQGAIRCYKEIATLLNKPIDYNLLGFDPKIAKTLTGDWTSEQIPGLITTVYIEDNQLLYKTKINSNTNIGKAYFLSETKLANSNIQFNTIVNNGNEIVIKLNGVTLKKTKG
nr:hypothetical protein [uncultured Psychroserpens sp.]